MLYHKPFFFLLLLFSFILLLCLVSSHARNVSRMMEFENASSVIHETTRTKGSRGVQLIVQDEQVIIDNGIIRLVLSKPQGRVKAITYNRIENLIEFEKGESNLGGYWDVRWSKFGSNDDLPPDVLDGTDFEVIVQNVNQVEVSFKIKWNSSQKNNVPLNIDKRFIVLGGKSGFYSYAIFEHKREWPGFKLQEARMAFKLNKDKFRYMAISDRRQREMPSAEDRAAGRSKTLAYPEAVRFIKPINPALKGEVDDKYQYSMDNMDNKVHGWISSDDPPTGFWLITASDEFLTGGPLKQDLTSHVGPTTLAMFISNHYAGDGLNPRFKNGEHWKKLLGPVFIYLNSSPDKKHAKRLLWNDAKLKMHDEVKSWPYSFVASSDYPKANRRGSITGKLMVEDRYVGNATMPASWAYVGLAKPGFPGSWQKECKGYQFWTEANADGIFTIENIRPGVYNLYAWVPGFIGDYKYNGIITIKPGNKINFHDLLYQPPRAGSTVWQIGTPDRSASEFFIPDAKEGYINKLYLKHNRFRQYGLWDRYTDLHPNEDLVYEVGVSVDNKDWFFAHVTRKVGEKSYRPTTWQIKFELKYVKSHGSYTLRIALASVHDSVLQVRINNPNSIPSYRTPLAGKDNAIARHGIHGLYKLFNIPIESKLLKQGSNSIYLTQTQNDTFSGVMYDYIRLEEPDG